MMRDNSAYVSALTRLRGDLEQLYKVDPDVDEQRDEVLGRFQPIFSLEHIPNLTEHEFREFLIFKNNKHWKHIQRQGPRMCRDMSVLRDGLRVLLDESRPLAPRFTEALDKVDGLGKAVATPILLVADPERYGVWNRQSEQALKQLDLWPNLSRGSSSGDIYSRVNQILVTLAEDLGVDLWKLDALFYGYGQTSDDTLNESETHTQPYPDEEPRFELERHLHEFLRDNWDKTPLGKEWAIYDDGDPDAGYEYPTSIGYIDLLAQHRSRRSWLIIELKRGQSSDQTVGQVLRYIGWVREHLAADDESVRGLVISHAADQRIRYAIQATDSVELMVYEVDFHLKRE